VHNSQTKWLLDGDRLTNLSLRVARASATSLNPTILIHSAAVSKVLTLKFSQYMIKQRDSKISADED